MLYWLCAVARVVATIALAHTRVPLHIMREQRVWLIGRWRGWGLRGQGRGEGADGGDGGGIARVVLELGELGLQRGDLAGEVVNLELGSAGLGGGAGELLPEGQ